MTNHIKSSNYLTERYVIQQVQIMPVGTNYARVVSSISIE